MPQYKVKAGMYFGASRQYGPGAVVTLDAIAARRFLDKLELVPGTENVELPLQDPGLANDLEVQVPDEMKLMPGTMGEDTEPAGIKVDLGQAEVEKPAVPPPAPKSRTTRKKTQ